MPILPTFCTNEKLLPGWCTVLRWKKTDLELQALKPSKDGIVTVTECYAGVAETGTLASLSGGQRDSRFNFLSSTHIAVLGVADIVGSYEAVWKRI